MKKFAKLGFPRVINIFGNLPLKRTPLPKLRYLSRFCLFLWGCCSPAALWSQDSTRVLPLLTIQGTRFEQTGFKRWEADSLPVLAPISGAQRLSWESPLSVRITAPGTLATVSARGMGPTHTPVFWNGINLQSPMNGVVDVSLLPIWPDDQLALQAGGQSAGLGSGAMGGAVLLNTEGLLKSGFSGNAGFEAGSFGQKGVQTSLGYRHTRWQVRVRGNWQKATNNYPFRNTTQLGQPMVRQQNNALEKTDFQQYFQFRLNSKHQFRANFWQQRAFREIPQPITSAQRESWQKDRAHRGVFSWIYQPNAQSILQTKLALIDEWIAFRLSGDTDTSYAQTLSISSEFSRFIAQRFTLKTGLNALKQWARADGYADSSALYHQTRLAAYTVAEWRLGTGKLTGLLRQEWAQNQSAPFTWSLGGTFDLGKYYTLGFHYSRNFNMPTFNDRFWMAYGQANLASERGYSADVSWKMQAQHWQAEITAFQILIDDWILWQPGDDGIFRPGNLKKVGSNGLETVLIYPFKLKTVHFKAQMRYQLNRTTNLAVYNSATSSLSRQLLYVPIHSGSFQLTAAWRACAFAYTHQYTGKRYIQSDNSRSLPGFRTGNIYGAYQFAILKKMRLALDVRVENCWNQPYAFLAYQPMPGRSVHAGVRINW